MDSGATQTAGHRHNRDAASTEQLRVRSHHQPLLTLIEIGTQKSIFLLKFPSRLLVHTSTIKCFSPDVQLILAGMLRRKTTHSDPDLVARLERAESELAGRKD